jgi:hypothetical protein
MAVGSAVAGDMKTWYDAGLVSSPSMMLFGLNGNGKSSVAQRFMYGMAARGIAPAVFDPLKGEHVAAVQALGGTTVSIGPKSRDRINPLDLGALGDAAATLGGKVGEDMRAQATRAAVDLVALIVQVNRGRPLTDVQDTVLSLMVRGVIDRVEGAWMGDLLAAFDAPPPEALTGQSEDPEFRRRYNDLRNSVWSVLNGDLAQLVGGRASVRLEVGNPGGFCFDTSSIPASNRRLLSAAMLSTWSTCSTPPATSAQPAGRCGCSTRRASPPRSRNGSGTRSPTSPTRSGPPNARLRQCKFDDLGLDALGDDDHTVDVPEDQRNPVGHSGSGPRRGRRAPSRRSTWHSISGWRAGAKVSPRPKGTAEAAVLEFAQERSGCAQCRGRGIEPSPELAQDAPGLGCGLGSDEVPTLGTAGGHDGPGCLQRLQGLLDGAVGSTVEATAQLAHRGQPVAFLAVRDECLDVVSNTAVQESLRHVSTPMAWRSDPRSRVS